jgi:hypothetical protein
MDKAKHPITGCGYEKERGLSNMSFLRGSHRCPNCGYDRIVELEAQEVDATDMCHFTIKWEGFCEHCQKQVSVATRYEVIPQEVIVLE